ncbi:MAG: hypothetical protein GF408_05335 [Candidatus Omnitrophica bacterium]|nr:hypothetical protein [Candidatus Omnitrophota bacterium]
MNMPKSAVLTLFLLLPALVLQAGNAEAEDSVTVVSCAGEVTVTLPGDGGSFPCEPGQELKSGTSVATGEESFAELAFDRMEENTVRISENSRVFIRMNESGNIELVEGGLLTVLRNLPKGKTFRVRTPDAVCGARGTGWNTRASQGVTKASVFDGTVFMRGVNRDGTISETEVDIKEGYQRTILRYGDPGEMVPVPVGELRELKTQAGLLPGPKLSESADKARKLERHREGILYRRDEKRLESLRDKEDEAGPSGGSHKKFKVVH